MKNIFKFITISISLSIFLFSCNKDEEMNGTSTKELTLNISGLETLGPDFVYEGWLIVDGLPVSTGKFSDVSFPKSFTVEGDKLDNASKFVLSIEPLSDTDPAPSNTKILVGSFSGNSAMLNTGIVGDFSNIMGKYILATPTNGSDTNEKSGIWFLDATSGVPMSGLVLPQLPEGWIYEGWAVVNGVPVSTGTFTNVSATDNAANFSGSMALPMPNGTDGFFPGEDFLMNAPMDMTFPIDLSGGKAVISIEPMPDNSEMPFALKPLVGMIPENAIDHTLYTMEQNLGGFPSGNVTR